MSDMQPKSSAGPSYFTGRTLSGTWTLIVLFLFTFAVFVAALVLGAIFRRDSEPPATTEPAVSRFEAWARIVNGLEDRVRRPGA